MTSKVHDCDCVIRKEGRMRTTIDGDSEVMQDDRNGGQEDALEWNGTPKGATGWMRQGGREMHDPIAVAN
jgi:hypothetical protein